MPGVRGHIPSLSLWTLHKTWASTLFCQSAGQLKQPPPSSLPPAPPCFLLLSSVRSHLLHTHARTQGRRSCLSFSRWKKCAALTCEACFKADGGGGSAGVEEQEVEMKEEEVKVKEVEEKEKGGLVDTENSVSTRRRRERRSIRAE